MISEDLLVQINPYCTTQSVYLEDQEPNLSDSSIAGCTLAIAASPISFIPQCMIVVELGW
jgi:hypothetical protein